MGENEVSLLLFDRQILSKSWLVICAVRHFLFVKDLKTNLWNRTIPPFLQSTRNMLLEHACTICMYGHT